jgi:acetyltransferase-like isoleucine patch superfamily enzyme
VRIIRVSPRLLDLLRERHVYLSLTGDDRWAVGLPIGVPESCVIEPFTELCAGRIFPQVLGAFSYSLSELARFVRIGRYSSLAADIAWMGTDHPMNWASMSPAFHAHDHHALREFRRQSPEHHGIAAFPLPDRTVSIGNDVWIGDQAMLAPGITVGDGAVIGARTLVLKDVPPYAVVVGNPGRVIRYRFPEAMIARFLELAWWRFSPAFVGPLPVAEPEAFLDALAEKLERESPPPMAFAALTTKDLLATAEPQS